MYRITGVNYVLPNTRFENEQRPPYNEEKRKSTKKDDKTYFNILKEKCKLFNVEFPYSSK